MRYHVTLKEIISYLSTSIYLSKYAVNSSNPLRLLVANLLNPLSIIFLPIRRHIQLICSILVKDIVLNIVIEGRKYTIVVPDYRSVIIITPEYERDEYQAILKLIKHFKIKKFDVIISAGAHIGKWIFQISGLYDLFVAIEPIPITFLYLVRNIRINRIRNVIVANCGLSSKNGVLPFEVNPYKLDSSRVSVNKGMMIPVYSLDYLIKALGLNLKNKLILLILDVEGHEEAVLKGAIETMTRNNVLLYIELELEKDHLDKERKVLEFLHSIGFKVLYKRVHITYKRSVHRYLLANFQSRSVRSCTTAYFHVPDHNIL